METTLHYTKRCTRNEFIENQIGLGNPIRTFRWDKGHPNGPELHTITDTGIIIIRNERTNKLVTMLIARPGQIHRYYMREREKAPQNLLNLCYEHMSLGYNYI